MYIVSQTHHIINGRNAGYQIFPEITWMMTYISIDAVRLGMNWENQFEYVYIAAKISGQEIYIG